MVLTDAHALEAELKDQRSKAEMLEDRLVQSRADGQASSQQLHELQIQAKALDDRVKELVSIT
jgi:septal ring factor EnvC (AmiA/AmiB activator)